MQSMVQRRWLNLFPRDGHTKAKRSAVEDCCAEYVSIVIARMRLGNDGDSVAAVEREGGKGQLQSDRLIGKRIRDVGETSRKQNGLS